jgi:hypothetical protein
VRVVELTKLLAKLRAASAPIRVDAVIPKTGEIL